MPDLRDGAGSDDGSAGDEDDLELRDMSRRFWICLDPDGSARLALDGGDGARTGSFEHSDAGRSLIWVQLLLAAPVVLWGGLPFFERGWQIGRQPKSEYVHAHRFGNRDGVCLSARWPRLRRGVFPESFRGITAKWRSISSRPP